jgi:hypothetical protein
MIITSNTIKNIPITIDNINIAKKVFGPDVGASDYVEIPKELIYNHQSVVLCMDGIKINGVPFLTTISQNIMYPIAESVPHRTPEAHRSVLDNVFHTYNQAGFQSLLFIVTMNSLH